MNKAVVLTIKETEFEDEQLMEVSLNGRARAEAFYAEEAHAAPDILVAVGFGRVDVVRRHGHSFSHSLDDGPSGEDYLGDITLKEIWCPLVELVRHQVLFGTKPYGNVLNRLDVDTARSILGRLGYHVTVNRIPLAST